LNVLEWDRFAEMFRSTHKQGEHVAIVGPTGSGKSVLGLSLCKVIGSRPGKDRRPSRVVVLGTKPRDDTLSSLGWPIVKKWPPAYGQEHCIVWPRKGKARLTKEQERRTFAPLLDVIHQEGGQTVCIDEAATFERPLPHGLGLAGKMEDYWTTARASKLTLIGGTQRPRHVTRSMWSEPSWVMIFAPDDEDDLRRVAELSGAKEDVIAVAEHLGAHEFLCVRRQRTTGTKTLYVSKVR
jgi:energy-coupling factor transporter ATP-binding protein EcfA2